MNHCLWFKNPCNGYGIHLPKTRSLSDMLHIEEKWWTKLHSSAPQNNSVTSQNNSRTIGQTWCSHCCSTIIQRPRGDSDYRSSVDSVQPGTIMTLLIILLFYLGLLFTLCTKSCPRNLATEFQISVFRISYLWLCSSYIEVLFMFCTAGIANSWVSSRELALNTYFETIILSDIRITSSMTFSPFWRQPWALTKKCSKAGDVTMKEINPNIFPDEERTHE